MATTTIPYASIPEFLSHTNHKQWSLRVKTYLLSEDLWEVVEPATEIPKLEEADGEQENDGAKNKVWATKNAKALHIIHNSCGSDMFSVISEISNAQTAWAALEQWCKEIQKAINNAEQLERYIPFLDYVIAGDWGNAKQCLRALPDAIKTVDPRDENGDIALHVAARKGHLHIVKELVLLMRRVDLQAKNAKGSTAIHEAFQMNRVDIVKELLPRMGGVQNKDGDTVLHIAVRTQQPETVMWMVKLMRREDLEVKNNFALTALNIAVRMRNARIINMLLPYVAGDEFDLYIPFMNAVIGGDWNNVKDCLGDLDSKSAGCAVRARDPRDGHDENTALHVAIKHGHVHIVKELVSLMISHRNLQEKNADTFKGKQLNADISEAEVVERAKYMVEQDAIQLAGVLEIQNAFGDTPLHEAINEGQMPIVKELVSSMRQQGFEIKNYKGLTVLHQAVMSGNMGIVKELVFLMRHQGFAVKTNDGSTALHLAVMKADVDIVKMLVSQMRREDLEIKGALGNTALHQAVKMGNMGIVKELVILMRQEGLEVKNDEGSNALHLAAMEKKLDIVRELISLMRPEALEETNGEGVTALCCVLNARCNDGDIWEVAKCMAEKNKNVFGIRSPWKIIPVVWAADWGKWRLTHNFYSVTPPEALNGLQGAELMVFAIDRLKALDLAWDLLQRFPRLALYTFSISPLHKTSPLLEVANAHYGFFSGERLTLWQTWIYNRLVIQHPNVPNNFLDVPNSKDDQDTSSFTQLKMLFSKLLRISDIYKMKLVHQKINKILRCMGEVIKDYSLTAEEVSTVRASVFTAIEKGHVEFVTHMCEIYPKIMDVVHEDKGSIFHFAINCRQEKIYSLIYGLKEEQRDAATRSHIMKTKSSLLHSAANLSALSQFKLSSYIQGASLQMQRELQWFKEVESVVPPDIHKFVNSDGVAARQIFTQSHENLMKEAQESIKQTASSCTVVGSLIATMMFAAAFTVPGGNNGDTGFPLFIHEKLFLTFIVSDTLSLVSSTTSVIVFLGLLTSRYAEDDFLESLPRKLMIGLVTLFISIATMMIAFSSALIIMLHGRYSWIVAPSISLGSVPIASFVWVQFPLLLTTFISTYGPGIFDKKTIPWHF